MKKNDMLLLGLLGLGAFLYFQSRKSENAAPPIADQPAPTPISTYQKALPAVEVKYQSRVSGYFPSRLPGARPEMPYGVRWGDGRKFIDTTQKAKMVI